jgi:hypothetical protein
MSVPELAASLEDCNQLSPQKALPDGDEHVYPIFGENLLAVAVSAVAENFKHRWCTNTHEFILLES